MDSPFLMVCSWFLSAATDWRICSIVSSASDVLMLLENGPLLVNSSTRLATCFFKSSDWASRLVLNRSCTTATEKTVLSLNPLWTDKVKKERYLIRQDNTIYKFSIKLNNCILYCLVLLNSVLFKPCLFCSSL